MVAAALNREGRRPEFRRCSTCRRRPLNLASALPADERDGAVRLHPCPIAHGAVRLNIRN
nr:hypothetical protein Iba_scaffold11828CG0010 [Ipomoea batatas]GME19883.1 hypothetical protein Iba_scaffold24013CG0160 [Ipomoea batatas]